MQSHNRRPFHNQCSRAWVSHHRLFTEFCWSPDTVIATDECWFFGKIRGWLGLISAFCLDFVLAGNSHGFCMANVPLVLFMIYGIFLLGVGSLGGYFSTTKNSWMHPVAIQAKSFHSDNYSLLQFSRFRWFTCMLRFQAVCRFVASWCKKPTLCLTPAYCM